MSKPYLRINSVTHSAGVLTLDYTFWRLRGNINGEYVLSLDGFSDSIPLIQTENYALDGTIATLSLVTVAAGPNSTYVDPSPITWVFSGTPSTNTNITLKIDNVVSSSATSSTSDLIYFFDEVYQNLSLQADYANFTFATTSNSISIIPELNSGHLFNDIVSVLELTSGSGSISTGSPTSSTFSGGITTYNIDIKTPVGGFTNFVSVTSLDVMSYQPLLVTLGLEFVQKGTIYWEVNAIPNFHIGSASVVSYTWVVTDRVAPSGPTATYISTDENILFTYDRFTSNFEVDVNVRCLIDTGQTLEANFIFGKLGSAQEWWYAIEPIVSLNGYELIVDGKNDISAYGGGDYNHLNYDNYSIDWDNTPPPEVTSATISFSNTYVVGSENIARFAGEDSFGNFNLGDVYSDIIFNP